MYGLHVYQFDFDQGARVRARKTCGLAMFHPRPPAVVVRIDFSSGTGQRFRPDGIGMQCLDDWSAGCGTQGRSRWFGKNPDVSGRVTGTAPGSCH